MIFKGKEGEHEIEVCLTDDCVRLTTDYLPNETFGSLGALQAAIAKKELRARKDFTNRTAYVTDRWSDNTVHEVEVTSVDPDGARAWVKKPGGVRRLESMQSLFVDGEAVKKALANQRERLELTKTDFASLERWTPKP